MSTINQRQTAEPVKLITQENARVILGLKTTKTIRNMITRGELTGYRIRGVRAVRVDANEVRALIETMLATTRFGRAPFGPRAKIVNVGLQPVADESDGMTANIPSSGPNP